MNEMAPVHRFGVYLVLLILACIGLWVGTNRNSPSVLRYLGIGAAGLLTILGLRALGNLPR